MNGPYNSKNLRAVFPCGTDKYGEQAESSSELTVALSGQRVILTIEQTRHDICDPITGYGTDTNTSFIELDVDDTEKLISILDHHLSLIKETLQDEFTGMIRKPNCEITSQDNVTKLFTIE